MRPYQSSEHPAWSVTHYSLLTDKVPQGIFYLLSLLFYLLSKTMATHNLLGQIGEEEACRFLIRKGYTLLERNWRVGHLELDIIAECYGEIIFVEVKTRSNEDFAPAITAVDDEKIKNLRLAARHYLDLNRLDQPIRFDIITVVGSQKPFTITHYVGGS